MSKPKNNHYNSEFLTEPWEFPGRKLWFYDFLAQELDRDGSYRLFAEKKVFPPDIEIRYNELVDTPLARLIQELRLNGEAEITDWKIQRAAYLAFLAQGPRVLEARKESLFFRELMSKPVEVLDAFVAISMKNSQLTVVRAPTGKRFYFPEIGAFAFPVEDSGCATLSSIGMGMSISPKMALVLVSNTVTLDALNFAPIPDFSVGLTESCQKVLIPPEAQGLNDEKKLIKHTIDSRSTCKQLVSYYAQARELAEKLYAASGILLVRQENNLHNRLYAEPDNQLSRSIRGTLEATFSEAKAINTCSETSGLI